jgi:hypothetical protein
MPSGQNCRGAATSGLTTPIALKRDTRACDGRRLSSDVDARTHPAVEQGVQATSAALLEGEEMETPSLSSDHAAALVTPPTLACPLHLSYL